MQPLISLSHPLCLPPFTLRQPDLCAGGGGGGGGGGGMLPLSEGFIRPGRMGYGTVLLRDIVPVEWQLCVKGYNNGTPGLMVDKKFHTFL